MQCYLAVVIVMSVYPARNFDDYWLDSEFTGSKWIKMVMSRDQFLDIHRSFQYNLLDFEGEINLNSQRLIDLSWQLTLDETVFLYKGRSLAKVCDAYCS